MGEKMARVHQRVDARFVAPLEQRRIGARCMHPHGAGAEEDPRRQARGLHHRRDDRRRERVVHHGAAVGVDGDPVAGHGAVVGHDEDHLQPGKGVEQCAVLGTEAGEVLGRHERKIHARLKDESLVRHVEVVTLRVTDVVHDRPRVLGDQNVRRMRRVAVPKRRQVRAEARAQHERGAADRAAAQHDRLRPDAVVARRPLPRRALGAGRGRVHAHQQRALLDASHLGAGDHLHARRLGGGELHAVRPLLGEIRAAQVAETGTAAPLEVERELRGVQPHRAATGDEEMVVLVDVFLVEKVHRVLLGVQLRAAHEVGVCQPRHVPAFHGTRHRHERGAGVGDGRAAIGATHGERHAAVGGLQGAPVLEQGAAHLELAAGELGLRQPRPLLKEDDPHATRHEVAQGVRDRAAAGPRADDRDVELALDHDGVPSRGVPATSPASSAITARDRRASGPRAPQPRGSLRQPRAAAASGRA